jgi:LPS-assembly protein
VKKLFFIFFLLFSKLSLADLGRISVPAENRAAARIGGFTITSDNLSRDLEKNTLILSGNVHVTYQKQSFIADVIEIDQNLKRATLRGHVQIFMQDFEIGGDEIRLDYESEQSIIINGYVKSNNIQFHGSLIEQESSKVFSIQDAEYTTCSNCPASWSFSGSKIKAELGGYAALKNPFLKVSGIPFFWLPYLVVPLKSERQSGLLFPEIGYINNRGVVYTQSLFWAIDRSEDLTLTFKNYELGGLKQMLEYRYALTDESFGEIHASHINDTVFKSDDRYNFFRSTNNKEDSFNRWSFRSEQQYTISDSTQARLKVNQISDLQYPKDFFDEFKNYAESGLENRLTLTNKSDHTVLGFDLIYFKHVLEANPLTQNLSAVHKLPEITFNSQLKNIGSSPFYYKFNIEATRFDRKKKYDDISVSGTGQKFVTNQSNNPACDKSLSSGSSSSDCDKVEDGIFNDGIDLLRAGDRVLFSTSILTSAYTISAFNFTPQVSYFDAQYFFPQGNQRYNHRRSVQFDLMSRSKLYKIYESENLNTSDLTEKKYKHELIPEITYTWVPWIDQESNSFWGGFPDSDAPFKSPDQINDTDINASAQNSLQFDTKDRIYEKHLIKFSLLNRVIRKNIKDSSYDSLLTFNLSQSYDLYQTAAKNNINKPLSTLDGTLDLSLNGFTFNERITYSPYAFATDSSSTLTYQNNLGQYLKLGYVSTRINPSTQVDDLALAIGFVTNYLNLLTGVVIDTSENRNTDSRLKQHSLIAQLKPPGECWGINFRRDQKTGAGAEWKISFDFSFDGKPTKVIPPSELRLN